jgi:hypothetical protein
MTPAPANIAVPLTNDLLLAGVGYWKRHKGWGKVLMGAAGAMAVIDGTNLIVNMMGNTAAGASSGSSSF